MRSRKIDTPDDKRNADPENDHDCGEARSRHAQTSMDVEPMGSDQQNLCGEQRQPSREGRGVYMHHQRVCGCVCLKVMPDFATKPGHYRHRDQGDIGNQESVVPGVMRREQS
jgi:hypothetical protein